ncbi:hypothetical protein DPMN_152554 [Dreissena polymorpha]|uniref:Peptidase M12A domain-containing protein n=1 Tax=Dreissena polymorpha TaxID=45954 RepID=A0A9D4J597_DREPO|nr:hypothetical protein DPMN_152554 [Dreissena polymorpha]
MSHEFDKIDPREYVNFNKPYDYRSIMHYSKRYYECTKIQKGRRKRSNYTLYPKSKDRILEEEEISNTKYKTGDVLIVENNRITPQLRIIRSPADVSDLQASGRLDTSEPFALDE